MNSRKKDVYDVLLAMFILVVIAVFGGVYLFIRDKNQERENIFQTEQEIKIDSSNIGIIEHSHIPVTDTIDSQ